MLPTWAYVIAVLFSALLSVLGYRLEQVIATQQVIPYTDILCQSVDDSFCSNDTVPNLDPSGLKSNQH